MGNTGTTQSTQFGLSLSQWFGKTEQLPKKKRLSGELSNWKREILRPKTGGLSGGKSPSMGVCTKCAQMNEYRQTSLCHNSFYAETLFKSLLLRTKREPFGSYFCAGGFEPERRVPAGGKTAEALPAAEKARRFW